MKEHIADRLGVILKELGVEAQVKLDYPENPEHGDFSTNIALAYAKKMGMSPRALAENIVDEFKKNIPESVASVDIAGAGFINFKIKEEVFAKEIVSIASAGAGKIAHNYGKLAVNSGKKILVEYTDPNTFKTFHIGHLMANAIGESISRLVEYSGASVVRICYPSDIGLHIAKSIWALEKHKDEMPPDSAPIQDRTAFLGKMYVEGTRLYESDPAAKDDIDALNKVIYERSNPAINALYEKGRRWSLDHFEMLYAILGTHFDEYIYESEMAPVGLEVVKAYLAKGVFEESEGAIVFKGEQYGLHTRVFINSHGLPTYEAKEVGLNMTKFKKYPDTEQSIIVTANEQNAYFKVLIQAISMINAEQGAKTRHIGHGMLRFSSGKMSSRTGNVISAESLLADIKELVRNKIAERKFTPAEAEEISNDIAVGAIKYTILRSSIGGDVIFDSAASISFEGDSGPYLQYSAVRATSILAKAKQEGIFENADISVAGTGGAILLPEKVSLLEKLITRFPDVIERAQHEYAPQHVANYLITLAGAFNSFYASQVIVDKNNNFSAYYVALTKVFVATMTNGLWVLGIRVPKKM